MLSYFLCRWQLSRAFEVCGSAYLYRRTPTAHAVQVTADEKAQIFRAFGSTYWKYHAGLWISFILLISAAVGAAVVLDAPGEAGTIIGYVAAAFLFVAIVYVNRRVLAVATALVEHRQPVTPRRQWLQVMDERLAAAAWWRLIAGGVFLGALAWLTTSIITQSVWGGLVWLCYFGACFFIWTRNVWRKWRMGART